MAEQLGPRKTPCATCPYRRGVPSGVWHPEEYAKLPAYDRETFAQPAEIFMCHQGEGEICSGWFCHGDGPWDRLAVRLAVISGRLDPEALDHDTDVPLFASGAEAAAHGLQDVETPDDRARSAIDKLTRKRNL